MASTQKRSRQLKVTLTPEMHARLVSLSEKLGQTPATLGSVAISLYVAQQENALGASQRAVEAMVGNFTPELQQHLGDMLRSMKDAE